MKPIKTDSVEAVLRSARTLATWCYATEVAPIHIIGSLLTHGSGVAYDLAGHWPQWDESRNIVFNQLTAISRVPWRQPSDFAICSVFSAQSLEVMERADKEAYVWHMDQSRWDTCFLDTNHLLLALLHNMALLPIGSIEAFPLTDKEVSRAMQKGMQARQSTGPGQEIQDTLAALQTAVELVPVASAIREVQRLCGELICQVVQRFQAHGLVPVEKES